MAAVLRVILVASALLLALAPVSASDAFEARAIIEHEVKAGQSMRPGSLPSSASECVYEARMISFIEPGSSFRFFEQEAEQGCVEVRFPLRVPDGSTHGAVAFGATREVQGPSQADMLPQARFLQRLTVVQDGRELASKDIFDPSAPASDNQEKRLDFALSGVGTLYVTFTFIDLGQTTSQPITMDSQRVSVGSDITRPRVTYHDVPLPLEQSTNQKSTESETWRYQLYVPPSVVSLEAIIPFGQEVVRIAGPIDSDPAYTTGPGFIRLEGPRPGYHDIYTHSALPPPIVDVPWLPAATAGISMVFLAGASFSTYRFHQYGHPSQHGRQIAAWIATGASWAAWSAASIALLWQAGVPLDQVPLRPGAALWLSAFGAVCLVCAAVIFNTVQWTRRGQHLHHEEELETYITRLARSNRDLEEFAYVASHDLQAPLRRIRGFLELLERKHGASLPADAQEFLARSVENSTHLQQLIRDLLSFARLDQRMGTRSRLPIQDAIKAALDEHEDALLACGAKVDIHVEHEVIGSPSLVRELFSNLIHNAITYRDASRSLSLHMTSGQDEDSVWIRIRDNGRGIHPNSQGRIFELFSRADADTDGTGIGLASCRRIAELHGGSLELASSGPEGSTFLLTLPLAMRPAEPVSRPSAAMRPVRPRPA